MYVSNMFNYLYFQSKLMKNGLQIPACHRHVDQTVYVTYHPTAIRTSAHVSRRLKALHLSAAASALQATTVRQIELVLTTSARTHVPDLAELIRNVLYDCTAQCALV